MNMENSVNCWKLLTDSAEDNQQPSPNGKVQRLERGCSYIQVDGSAEHPAKDDDIVCSSRKLEAAKQVWKLYKIINLKSDGINNFKIELVAIFSTKEDCCLAEQQIIATSQEKLYNLAKGGEVGYSMSFDSRYNSWKEKLKEKRLGKKPALGMKHSEENKKFFSECSKYRWDIYGRYPKDIITMSFKEAKEKFGISKTHYYRMRHLTNDQV